MTLSRFVLPLLLVSQLCEGKETALSRRLRAARLLNWSRTVDTHEVHVSTTISFGTSMRTTARLQRG